MNYYFDEDTQKLIVLAKKEMYDLKHPYVGSEHLFLAFLKQSSFDITKKLNEFGITYSLFRKELIDVVGVGSKSNEWFLFTPLLRKILNNATYYSKNSSNYVTPYHLLISILQEGDGVANRILLGMNIDLNALYDKFLNYDLIPMKEEKLLLDELAINMNQLSKEGRYDPVIGRDDQINQVIQILLRKNKNNPLLIGEAGVGKTAIVEELARRISVGNVPYKLKDKVIYNLSMSVLVSGTKYRGEFEEKIHKIITEVKNHPNILLFIDEIHTLIGAGGAEGAIDASNIVKPYLARGDLRVIGATTTSEYSQFILKDKALDRRFQKVYVEEPSFDVIKQILLGLKGIYESFHHVVLSENILTKIIDYSNQIFFHGRQPDKAIDLLDEVCSYASIQHNKKDLYLRDYDIQIHNLIQLKNDEIIHHNFKKALEYKEKEIKLQKDYDHLLIKYSSLSSVKVRETDLYQVLYQKLNIPSFSILKKKVSSLRKDIQADMVGQDKVLKIFLKKVAEEDFLFKKAPLSFLFVGKRGVGKTFLSEKVEKHLFTSNQVYRFSMLDYQDPVSLYKLKGNELEESPFLSICENPFSLIVFENIDKAHPSILKVITDAVKTGFFRTSKGENISIARCIIIFTLQSSIYSVGFSDNKKFNSYLHELEKNVSSVLYFQDIHREEILKYVLKNNSSLESHELDSILQESEYETYGFLKVEKILKNKAKI